MQQKLLSAKYLILQQAELIYSPFIQTTDNPKDQIDHQQFFEKLITDINSQIKELKQNQNQTSIDYKSESENEK